MSETDPSADNNATDDEGQSTPTSHHGYHTDGIHKTRKDDAAYAVAESMHDVYYFSEERSGENWSSMTAHLRARVLSRKEDPNWPYAIWCGRKRDYFRPYILSQAK